MLCSTTKYNASHDDLSQKDILDLLDALMYSEAASKLRYPGEVIVYPSIVSIRKLVYRDHTSNLAPFHNLIDRVLGRSSDDVIWAETFRLISISCPSTPLPKISPPIESDLLEPGICVEQFLVLAFRDLLDWAYQKMP
ncbi:hypothetical protein F4680DRAFT_452198 [Xylaria scruposa]|nr:hypothetical protein F4680DRAFT_452198 [Xylaria scruposa]